ncbi:MAG TPA: DUF305 domain-containing protein [Candidatus Nanoarchaeia archaeon]|nr:DUF305 domain-containing protein [Candidatus Nanoarchaeia archaeon]
MVEKRYKKFFVMLIISFFIMYVVMFLNVDSLNHIYFSMTRFYMALLMVAPMGIIMLFMMKGRFNNKRLNRIILISGIVIFILALVFLRTQTFIQDEQYIKAMIPHHSSAILTSQEAEINNYEVKNLSKEIIKTQKREINLMKELLNKI